MKQLYIVRHAKSSWQDPHLDDFDRPLNARGERDAPVMGSKLCQRKVRPDILVTSPANRAFTTAQIIAAAIGFKTEKIIKNPALYLASLDDLHNIINDTDEANSTLMIVGHNPGLTALANHLCRNHLENIPTCGIFCAALEHVLWKDVKEGSGRQLFFDYPKKEQ